MRLKLIMLSVLRVLPMARHTFIVLLSVLLLAGSSTCLAATHKRVHHKAAAAQASHTRATGKPHSPARTFANRRRRTSSRRTSIARSRRRARYLRAAAVIHARSPRSSAPADLPVVVPADVLAVAPAETILRNEVRPEETPTAPVGADRPAPSPSSELALSAAPMNAIPLHSEIVVMAPLRGSMESLVRQNEKTDADNLERIQDDADLRDRIAHGVLVPVPTSDALTINANLPSERRYCRPWTASFLTDLARAHDAEFHHPFEVSSAVRTVEYQKKLMRSNGNAAAAVGDVASPHLTGATIDIAKSGLSRSEIYWMRNRLSALQDEGKIDVEEEFRQACFHITVYKSYIGAGPAHKPHHPPAPEQPAPAVPEGDSDTGS